MRRVVRAAYLGEKLGDTSALENPARWMKSSAQRGRRVGRAITPVSADLGEAAVPCAPWRPRRRAEDCPPYQRGGGRSLGR